MSAQKTEIIEVRVYHNNNKCVAHIQVYPRYQEKLNFGATENQNLALLKVIHDGKEKLSVRAIGRKSGLTHKRIQNNMKKLSLAGLITFKGSGYYRRAALTNSGLAKIKRSD